MKTIAKRSSLFLLELIIAIGMFCIASAICVQIFVKSHDLETRSTELNHAVNAAISTAELFRSSSMDSGEIYYDSDWNACTSEQAEYTVKLDVESANSLQKAEITVYAKNDTLYQLEVLKNENTEVSE